MGEDYTLQVLYEIADEAVPQAAAPQESLFSIPFYIGICVLGLILVYVIHYICVCMKYQKRVSKITGKKQPFQSARKGRQTVYETEVQKAEQLYNKLMLK